MSGDQFPNNENIQVTNQLQQCSPGVLNVFYLSYSKIEDDDYLKTNFKVGIQRSSFIEYRARITNSLLKECCRCYGKLFWFVL